MVLVNRHDIVLYYLPEYYVLQKEWYFPCSLWRESLSMKSRNTSLNDSEARDISIQSRWGIPKLQVFFSLPGNFYTGREQEKNHLKYICQWAKFSKLPHLVTSKKFSRKFYWYSGGFPEYFWNGGFNLSVIVTYLVHKDPLRRIL